MAQTRSPRPEVLLIEADEAVTALAERVQKAPRVAIDTEAASYHRYVDRIYLLQISTPDETAIVDPVACSLKPIGKILADPDIEVVFHDADYDVRVLDRDYGFRVRNIFDTRIAAQLLGEPSVGLGALLAKYYGVDVDKRFQRADWSRRPLTPEMIGYAAGDTSHLLSLRDELHSQLVAKDRHEWAMEDFKHVEKLRWTPSSVNGDGYLRVKGAKAMPPRSLAVLKSLYDWRESKAASLDRAPFRVLGNDSLSSLAKAAPTSPGRLRRVSGVPASAVRRFGQELLGAVRAGLETPAEKMPVIERSKRPKPNRAAQDRLSRLKALRKERAAALGIEVGILCPNGTLMAVALAAPTSTRELRQVGDLKKWQCAALGTAEMLQAVNGAS